MDLSIIIPAYNMQGYIARCLRSVVHFPKDGIEVECIVVNDGKTDDTAAIVRRYAQRDKRIKLVEAENRGVPDAMNKGLEAAKGSYIMFLDADDALCEDAWEHISAAIEEEYADFMAFSYIALYGNGKMKAQMLPLKGVISTDAWEARRLMYADSVFNTCWGKLFRMDLIVENRLALRTDLPIGGDFLFVAEYVRYCETFYMTKAMVVYCLQKGGSAMDSYTFLQRLSFMKILYGYSREVVQEYGEKALMEEMQAYYVRVIADLFLEYARGHKKDDLARVYAAVLKDGTVCEILNRAAASRIGSAGKRYEYKLLKSGRANALCRYFRLKAKL